MYYVAKLFSHSTPLIVEQFEELRDALDYAEILNRSGKGKYVVLRNLTLQEADQ